MGNVLGIIDTFLENYQGFFENLRMALLGQKISLPLPKDHSSMAPLLFILYMNEVITKSMPQL